MWQHKGHFCSTRVTLQHQGFTVLREHTDENECAAAAAAGHYTWATVTSTSLTVTEGSEWTVTEVQHSAS